MALSWLDSPRLGSLRVFFAALVACRRRPGGFRLAINNILRRETSPEVIANGRDGLVISTRPRNWNYSRENDGSAQVPAATNGGSCVI